MSKDAAAGRLKTGLIGAGSFAGYHAGKLASLGQSDFRAVFDPDHARAAAVADKYACQVAPSVEALIAEVEALIIASPATTHYAFALQALEAGCHVYVEKPLAEYAKDAEALVRLADEKGLVLQVGHQERFVARALGLFDAPVKPTRIEAVREGPGSGRGEDVSVTLDLLIHDLDLAIELIGADPVSVTASGEGDPLNDVVAEVQFANGASAWFRSSRRAQARARTMRIVYPSGSADVDFVARTMRDGTGFGLDPDFAAAVPDPLGASVEAFLMACLGQGDCPSPGAAAAKAVRLANMIDAAAAA
ncbi:MAG: Gfo/Idh/MocA family oxidoreductase [Caulobacterales bacterium]